MNWKNVQFVREIAMLTGSQGKPVIAGAMLVLIFHQFVTTVEKNRLFQVKMEFATCFSVIATCNVSFARTTRSVKITINQYDM